MILFVDQGMTANLAPKFIGSYEVIGRPENNIDQLCFMDVTVEEVQINHQKPFISAED